MRKKTAQQKFKNIPLIFSFFLILTIPLVVWGLQNENFDIRNRAFEDIDLSEENPCIISLPNVNPYTLEVGQNVMIQVDAKIKDTGMSSLLISDSAGSTIYQESFENAPLEIATSFKFTPTKSGSVDLLGLIQKNGGGSIGCKISSPYDILGLKAQPNNQSPEFTSAPSTSKPSQDIKTNDTYEYTLVASDTDKDRINYSFSFTPKADWLKPVIIEDGSKGKLTIKFQGSTSKPASYLANVFIHDGYSKHLKSQSWIISVSPKENDIPIVKIIDPSESIKVKQGDKFNAQWSANDLNHITKYQIFMGTNPTDEKSWTSMNDNISYKANAYSVNTTGLKAGTYKLIIKAIDNQNPPLTGFGVSPEIVVTSDPKIGGRDDEIILDEPQITNMIPTGSDEVSNKRPTIKATIISGKDGKIDEKTIIVKVDDKDVSSKIKINKISDQEFTVIYQPEEDLTGGEHKVEVSFDDTSKKTGTKAWTFKIIEETQKEDGFVNIFGYDISQRTLIIIGVGILVVLIAIVAPMIIFSVWKDKKKEEDIEPVGRSTIPSTPDYDFNMPITQEYDEVKTIIETPVSTIVEEEIPVQENFSAPTPVEVEEEIIPVYTPTVETQEEISEPEQPEIYVPEVQIEEKVKEPDIVTLQPIVEEINTEVNISPIVNIPEPEVVPLQDEQIIPEPIMPEAPVNTIIDTPTTNFVAPEPEVVPLPQETVIPFVETPTPVQTEEVPVTPIVNTPTDGFTPPEPDLEEDLSGNDDIEELYKQIQQLKQNSPEDTQNS